MSAERAVAPDYAGHSEAHTPGPWTHEYEIDGPIRRTRIKAAGRAVASTSQQCGRPHWYDEAEANAQLIAAAPDMLAALSACPLPSTMGSVETHYQRFYDWYHAHVLPAIAKAEVVQ